MIPPRAVLTTLAAAALLAGTARAATPAERPPLLISGADFRPLPIAVAGFGGEGEAEAPAKEATAVVRADLALSGLFDVLDPRGFLADAREGFAVATVAFNRWVDVGAEGLVKAKVARVGGELVAELHLYEVRAGREVLVKPVRAAGARALGHRLADEIVRHYTREPGPFASRIAAIRKAGGLYELVAFDVDGQGAQVLLSEKEILLAPAWRPDGAEILVTSYRSGRPELWAYRLADRSFRALTHRGNAMGGVYSPDGRRIAFALTEGGNTDVWVMNADGSSPERLTREPAIDVSPSWSPDGNTFQANYNQTPVWSPRGDAIAFTARDERKVFDVFWVSPDTGVISRITQDQGRTNEEPSYAPNGRLLVFRTDRNGYGQLVVSDPRGDRQTVIFGAKGADLVAPTWGPSAQ
jgi:TolB protein